MNKNREGYMSSGRCTKCGEWFKDRVLWHGLCGGCRVNNVDPKLQKRYVTPAHKLKGYGSKIERL